MWFWLATSSFSDVGATIVSGHLSGHALLGGVGAAIAPAAAKFIGAGQLLAAISLLLPVRFREARRCGAWLSATLAGIPLTLLLTNPVWMESLGGFPAIGSGQGLLKYASTVGLGDSNRKFGYLFS